MTHLPDHELLFGDFGRPREDSGCAGSVHEGTQTLGGGGWRNMGCIASTRGVAASQTNEVWKLPQQRHLARSMPAGFSVNDLVTGK